MTLDSDTFKGAARTGVLLKRVCAWSGICDLFMGGGGGFDSLHHQQLSKQVVCVLPLTRPTYGGIIYYEKCAEHVMNMFLSVVGP